MRIERAQWQMVVVLVVVAVVATMVLALMDLATREPIAEARKAALHKALVQVLPAHANDPQADPVEISSTDEPLRFYRARDAAGNIIGVAWEMVAPDGYAGSIYIMIGVRPDGSVQAIRITDHRETPGLGDGIVHDRAWLDAFGGRTLDNAKWDVKKDGGDFDQFTGATITPRAVVRAVKHGLQHFQEYRLRLLSPRGGER